jgi:hypothetical protein
MPHFPNTMYLLYTRQECRVCSKISNKCTYRYPHCYPLEKIVSDDSWHIPGFLSALSNCWTQKSLVTERLNSYSQVCFSQTGWIFTQDGSAFNFPRDATLLTIWAFPSGLKQGKILMSYEHQLLVQKTKTWKTEKILFYPKHGRRTAFSHGWNKWKHGKR